MRDGDLMTEGLKPRRRIIRAEEAAQWVDGATYLDAARRDATAIRATAMDAYDAERRRGFEDGAREGAEAGARLMADARQQIDAYFAELERALPALVLDVTERVLGALDREELVTRAAVHALSRMRRDRPLVLLVPPALVEKVRGRLAQELGPDEDVRVEADPHLGDREAVIASDAGFVDVGVDAQLSALREGLEAPQ